MGSGLAVDLLLVVLPGLAEYGQEHDSAISSTPVQQGAA